MCRNSGKNARDKTSLGHRPGGKENNMAGKSNAKPAKQAEPAKDAAMAETTAGAAEQAVTPPAQEGEAGTDAAPAEGQGQQATPAIAEAAPEVFAEMQIKAAVAELSKFFEFCNHVFAAALEKAEVRIRDNGRERPATADDLLAVSLKGQTVTIVTKDGQKHTLKEGSNNEAQ
jgi:hypothetical protein